MYIPNYVAFISKTNTAKRLKFAQEYERFMAANGTRNLVFIDVFTCTRSTTFVSHCMSGSSRFDYLHVEVTYVAFTANPHLWQYNMVCVVLGNNTCDLDSAVCALVQGLYEYLEFGTGVEHTAVIPLMNIPREEYRIKTEVKYFFERYNISPDLLTFRDEINLKGLYYNGAIPLNIVLVDHHTLSDEDIFLKESVIKVIDHRPRNPEWLWPNRDVCIEPVGSCATLVAKSFLVKYSLLVDTRIANLLRGPILIDTFNLSEKAEKGTPTDMKVLKDLECIADLSYNRDTEYQGLIQAKFDISKLSHYDLLLRDTKVVDGVPIVGLPILVQNFIESSGGYEVIYKFAVAKKTRIVFLLGMEVDFMNTISRDIAIFSLSTEKNYNKCSYASPAEQNFHEDFEELRMLIFLSDDPDLKLHSGFTALDYDGKYEMLYAKLGNNNVSRKQILPLVQGMMKRLSILHKFFKLKPIS